VGREMGQICHKGRWEDGWARMLWKMKLKGCWKYEEKSDDLKSRCRRIKQMSGFGQKGGESNGGNAEPSTLH